MKFTLLNDGIPGYVSAGIHPMQPGNPWHEWRASAINWVFGNQGVRGASEPGISAETVRDGEKCWLVEVKKVEVPKPEPQEDW